MLPLWHKGAGYLPTALQASCLYVNHDKAYLSVKAQRL